MSACGILAADCIVRLPFEDDNVVEDAASVSSLGPARAPLLSIEETCVEEPSIVQSLPTRTDTGSKDSVSLKIPRKGYQLVDKKAITIQESVTIYIVLYIAQTQQHCP